jgi:predicted nucleic acid-binding protein
VIAVVDTSVVVRVILGEPDPLPCWGAWEQAFVSSLVRTEFYRVADRLRLEGRITDQDRVQVTRDFDIFWSTCHKVFPDERILNRAAGSFPTVLGTLDAIHLSTLLLLEPHLGNSLTMLTHDQQLAVAATACGVEVLGVSA